MFIFPIRTDRRLHHTPWVNYALIAANVAAFVWTHSTPAGRAIEAWLVFDPSLPGTWRGIPYQVLTYQFLHADWMHILGNMIFLFVFGNSVEDRLGKVGYLAFYLAGGVLAALGHAAIDPARMVGASGSIAAVTGAYLALFPLSRVTVFYWVFLFLDTFEISSIYLILFQVGENVLYQLMGSGGVAYAAHLAGYAFGFVVGMGLLALRLLPREPYDLLTMIEHRRRRSAFRKLTQRGYRPWEAQAGGAMAADAPAPAPLTAQQQRILETRRGVLAALEAHDLPGAAARYADLLALDPAQTFSQQQQLDLANQWTSEGRYSLAARAYELFLRAFDTYPQREQVQLILGLIYARYVRQATRAVELLTAALPRLADAGQRALAQQLLAEAQGR